MRYEYRTLAEKQLLLEMVQNERAILPGVGVRKLHSIIFGPSCPQQVSMGMDALFALLRENSMLLRRSRGRARTTNSHHSFRRYPNLAREMTVDAPHQLWVSDITYIDTMEGFMYLSLVTDAYSRKIIGWDISPKLKASGAIGALNMAISQLPHGTGPKPVHHSDRGIQYCCDRYIIILKGAGIGISMTEKVDPLENAIAERVNGILKTEWLKNNRPRLKVEAIDMFGDIVSSYNGRRPHLSLNMQTPDSAHMSHGPIPRAWKNYWKERHKYDQGTNPCMITKGTLGVNLT